MKDRTVVPVRTGRLYGSIHAHPTVHPAGVAAGVNYAFAANIRSSKTRFIERTHAHIIRIVPSETTKVMNQALKGMDK